MRIFKKGLNKIFNRKPFNAVGIDSDNKNWKVYFLIKGKRECIDNRHALVALKPVIISISWREGYLSQAGVIQIEKNGKLMGSLNLEPIETIIVNDQYIILYKINEYKNYLFSLPYKIYNDFYLRMQNISSLRPYNFIMPVAEQNKLHIYYMIPKPVVLITVFDGKKYDIFPMDIIGNATENIFLLGLRNTSPAIQKIVASARLCISGVPIEQKKAAYELGIHHKSGEVNLKNLPFKTVMSEKLNFEIPEFALNIMEVELLKHKEVGSHTLFITRILHSYSLNSGTQLAHSPWFMS